MNRPTTFGIIMAGGIGKRFWPMSRPNLPKQFIDILGHGHTMIQETVARLEGIVAPQHHYVLTGTSFKTLVQEQLPQLPLDHILTEPQRRNTAPCIAYAAFRLKALCPDATMIVTPSDHHIASIDRYQKTLQRAIDYVNRHHVLLTIGIQSTYPATGYGYIQQSNEAKQTGAGPIVRFKEKPEYNEAVELLATGDYLWNSGMFVWRVADIVAALEEHLPEIAHLFGKIRSYGTFNEIEDVAKAFMQSPSISIDYGVMERAGNVHTIRGDFGWDDLGTWQSLYRYLETQNGTYSLHTQADNCSNTLVRCADPHKRIIIQGLHDYLVVDTGDVLVIAPKGDENALHHLLDTAQEN